MVYELLKEGGKVGSTVVEGSEECFDKAAWKKIAEYSIFPYTTPKSGEGDLDLNGLRTGLRRGFGGDSPFGALISDIVKLQDNSGLDLMERQCATSGQGTDLSKDEAIVCLDKIQASRFVTRQVEGRKVVLLASQRAEVLSAIRTMQESSSKFGSSLLEKAVLDREAAELAAPLVKMFLKFTMSFDSLGRLAEFTIDRMTREQVGEEDAFLMGYSCWVNDRREGTKQDMVCKDIPVPK